MLKTIKHLIIYLLLINGVALQAAELKSHTILVLGDSLSAGYGIAAEAGWVNLLQQRLKDRDKSWQVINGSISGETTAGGLSRLPVLLARHQPDIVIIELGSNDGLRGLSFRQMGENLKAMVTAVENAQAKVVLVGGRLPPNYGSAFTEAFFQVFVEIAEEKQLPLVPFLLDGVAQDLGLMQPDGYHPTAEAQPRLLQNVWPMLEPVITKIEKEKGVGDK